MGIDKTAWGEQMTRKYEPELRSIPLTFVELLLREYDGNNYGNHSILVEVTNIIPEGTLPFVDKDYCIMTTEIIMRKYGGRTV